MKSPLAARRRGLAAPNGFRLGSDGVYRWAEFEGLPGLTHGFGTRLSENWPLEAVSLKQVHGDVCHVAVTSAGAIREGDALITGRPGVTISVRTADCIPILLFDPIRRAVAAVHAGWRGSESRIGAKTVHRMGVEFGVNPADLVALIGPGIGPCCFEVGEDVARRFPGFVRYGRVKNGDMTPHVDLWSANAAQLAEAGVGRIETAGLCTHCLAGRFHSFRRDKDQGRMVSAIGLT